VPQRRPDLDARPSPDGEGVHIIVNPCSGPVWASSPAAALREGLPGATVHELSVGDAISIDPDADTVALGAAGGDGTLSAVARLAVERDLSFVAVPSGTLNHLARDLGLHEVEDAIAAVRAGTITAMDLGMAGDLGFVNTLTMGGYTRVVDARERFERRLGRWPALLAALVVELRRMEPLRLEIDGAPVLVWLAWIGNGRYQPAGFRPSWREELDDGLLDVRLVVGDRPFSRLRFVLHVLAGRLASCPVYREWRTEDLSIRSQEGPLRLAADGETYDGPTELVLAKRRRALRVAVPPVDALEPRDSARPSSTASATSTTAPAAVNQPPAAS
jgi:undecaprenyl-diphosphatase